METYISMPVVFTAVRMYDQSVCYLEKYLLYSPMKPAQ